MERRRSTLAKHSDQVRLVGFVAGAERQQRLVGSIGPLANAVVFDDNGVFFAASLLPQRDHHAIGEFAEILIGLHAADVLVVVGDLIQWRQVKVPTNSVAWRHRRRSVGVGQQLFLSLQLDQRFECVDNALSDGIHG